LMKNGEEERPAFLVECPGGDTPVAPPPLPLPFAIVAKV
jgi:hypothetical protein